MYTFLPLLPLFSILNTFRQTIGKKWMKNCQNFEEQNMPGELSPCMIMTQPLTAVSQSKFCSWV
jgi:hypothetical protein